MYRQRGKPDGEQALGCWQVLGIMAVTLLAFLLLYEPITNLLR